MTLDPLVPYETCLEISFTNSKFSRYESFKSLLSLKSYSFSSPLSSKYIQGPYLFVDFCD